eukprot:CAMPEP_0202383000 /NCGR_PEP_ID=MMETSP1127-20130417/46599_1 /ASSEMBLY_ACC=CAM_ASM_000462 /TAXON_ID=3047 /ORGANISM="Dunaliella tertiolecta, Strain CCMP1320" /LENGTH=76 /DNA_ID=CAMNT_0048982353 /DNA_START=744 /DNA_END=971 /DNA_ORIENTATION=-
MEAVCLFDAKIWLELTEHPPFLPPPPLLHPGAAAPSPTTPLLHPALPAASFSAAPPRVLTAALAAAAPAAAPAAAA